MASERDAHQPPPGIPEVSPAVVRAYFEQQHDFEQDFARLTQENRAVAQAIMRASTQQGRHREELTINQKRTFAQGALFVYGLLRHGSEAAELDALFESIAGDDVDDEVRPP